MAEKRDDDRKADDQAPKKPSTGQGAGGGSGIDDRTSRAQEEAAKERAKDGGYQ